MALARAGQGLHPRSQPVLDGKGVLRFRISAGGLLYESCCVDGAPCIHVDVQRAQTCALVWFAPGMCVVHNAAFMAADHGLRPDVELLQAMLQINVLAPAAINGARTWVGGWVGVG